MTPIKEALAIAKQRCIDDNDPDDLLHRQHYMQLQTIKESRVAFETIQDYDWEVVSMSTMGLPYLDMPEMTFCFEDSTLRKFSREVSEHIKSVIWTLLNDDHFDNDAFPRMVLAEINKCNLVKVEPDSVGLRVIRPNFTYNPCYGDKEYHNVCYLVSIESWE